MVSIDSVIAAMKPADSHCARSWPSAKTRLMSGTATLMVVDAITDTITDAIAPIITVNRAYQRKFGPMRFSRAAREWGWVIDHREACGRCLTIVLARRMHTVPPPHPDFALASAKSFASHKAPRRRGLVRGLSLPSP